MVLHGQASYNLADLCAISGYHRYWPSYANIMGHKRYAHNGLYRMGYLCGFRGNLGTYDTKSFLDSIA
jgi:hypothetical protein